MDRAAGFPVKLDSLFMSPLGGVDEDVAPIHMPSRQTSQSLRRDAPELMYGTELFQSRLEPEVRLRAARAAQAGLDIGPVLSPPLLPIRTLGAPEPLVGAPPSRALQPPSRSVSLQLSHQLASAGRSSLLPTHQDKIFAEAHRRLTLGVSRPTDLPLPCRLRHTAATRSPDGERLYFIRPLYEDQPSRGQGLYSLSLTQDTQARQADRPLNPRQAFGERAGLHYAHGLTRDPAIGFDVLERQKPVEHILEANLSRLKVASGSELLGLIFHHRLGEDSSSDPALVPCALLVGEPTGIEHRQRLAWVTLSWLKGLQAVHHCSLDIELKNPWAVFNAKRAYKRDRRFCVIASEHGPSLQLSESGTPLFDKILMFEYRLPRFALHPGDEPERFAEFTQYLEPPRPFDRLYDISIASTQESVALSVDDTVWVFDARNPDFFSSIGLEHPFIEAPTDLPKDMFHASRHFFSEGGRFVVANFSAYNTRDKKFVVHPTLAVCADTEMICPPSELDELGPSNVGFPLILQEFRRSFLNLGVSAASPQRDSYTNIRQMAWLNDHYLSNIDVDDSEALQTLVVQYPEQIVLMRIQDFDDRIEGSGEVEGRLVLEVQGNSPPLSHPHGDQTYATRLLPLGTPFHWLNVFNQNKHLQFFFRGAKQSPISSAVAYLPSIHASPTFAVCETRKKQNDQSSKDATQLQAAIEDIWMGEDRSRLFMTLCDERGRSWLHVMDFAPQRHDESLDPRSLVSFMAGFRERDDETAKLGLPPERLRDPVPHFLRASVPRFFSRFGFSRVNTPRDV